MTFSWLNKLFSWLPSRWFGNPATPDPNIGGIITGLATLFDQVHANIEFVNAQASINTATGMWLDVAVADFLGFGNFPRRSGETDTSYRLRAKLEFLRIRNTRPAISDVLTNLTGVTPQLFAPRNVGDTGAYGVRGQTVGQNGGVQAAYNVSGRYGSRSIPYIGFCVATRPIGEGIPLVAGYASRGSFLAGGGNGAYQSRNSPIPNAGLIEYTDKSQNTGGVTDDEIIAAVTSTLAEGVECILSIKSGI